jgi:superfamily II DNA helicase RecQ
MTSGQMRRHQKGLLAAVARGLQDGPAYPPPAPRVSDRVLARLDALRNWRKVTARKIGVDSNVVFPRDVLEALAERPPRHISELEKRLSAMPWRFERFGEAILQVLSRYR